MCKGHNEGGEAARGVRAALHLFLHRCLQLGEIGFQAFDMLTQLAHILLALSTQCLLCTQFCVQGGHLLPSRREVCLNCLALPLRSLPAGVKGHNLR